MARERNTVKRPLRIDLGLLFLLYDINIGTMREGIDFMLSYHIMADLQTCNHLVLPACGRKGPHWVAASRVFRQC